MFFCKKTFWQQKLKTPKKRRAVIFVVPNLEESQCCFFFREAKYPFEQYGLIVEKAKDKEEASGMESACQSAERFPHIRENIMRNFTVYDPK